MGEGEALVMQRMAANGGVITRAEALALGMSPATLSRRVRSGHLVAVGRGIYALPGVLDSEHTLLRAATSALDAVASHESAALLHGLDMLDHRRVVVSVPIRRSNRFRGVIVHQMTDLTADETTSVLGITVTDVPRMILDLAAVLPPRLLAELTDRSVRMGLTTYQRIEWRLEEKARRGKPGVTKIRRVLEPRLGGTFVSESVLESRMFQIIEEAGLPRPTTQFHAPFLRRVQGRVDMAYVDDRVIIEGDSVIWHGSPEAFQADRTRDNLGQIAGWTILRFTWQDLTERPDYVVETIRQALELSARRRNQM